MRKYQMMQKEEMKMTQRTVKNQSSHIHDHRQRLKHVSDRLDANDEVASAFESLLMLMVKNLEQSGKWTEELQGHIDSIETAKVRLSYRRIAPAVSQFYSSSSSVLCFFVDGRFSALNFVRVPRELLSIRQFPAQVCDEI